METDPQPPVRLCCGQRHFGPVCPDGKVMCCLCFQRFDRKDLEDVKPSEDAQAIIDAWHEGVKQWQVNHPSIPTAFAKCASVIDMIERRKQDVCKQCAADEKAGMTIKSLDAGLRSYHPLSIFPATRAGTKHRPETKHHE